MSVASWADRHPLVRAIVGNAILVSLIYLVVGFALELLHRFYPGRWVDDASAKLDWIPTWILGALGLLGPIAEAHVYGHLSGVWVRVIFGATMIAAIFVFEAILVGTVALVLRGLRRLNVGTGRSA